MAARKPKRAAPKDDCPVEDQKSHGGSTGDGKPKGSFFTRFTAAVARFTGKPVTFIAAVVLIIVWAASGPLFGFGDTWQLVINTSTTIITFLMVFVIQASQNRDTASMHLKLDELIRATGAAHNALLDIDSLDEDQLEKLRKRYEDLASSALQEADIIESMEDAGAAKPRRKPRRDSMDAIAAVGSFAAICSSISFAPQAWKTLRTGETKDISAASFAFTVAAFAAWIVYGAARSDWPLLINGTICFLLSGFILTMTLIPKSWKKRMKRVAD